MTETLTNLPTIDVRLLPPQERHPKIFAMLEALTPKMGMLLVSDHDPVPLRRHIACISPACSSGWRWRKGRMSGAPKSAGFPIPAVPAPGIEQTSKGGRRCPCRD